MKIVINNTNDFKELPLRKKLVLLLAIPLIILAALALVGLIIGLIFAVIIPIIIFVVVVSAIIAAIGVALWVLTRSYRKK